MPWACCLWQGLFQLLANDEHTHENTIPTFLCSGDGNLASNEVQASSGKEGYATKEGKRANLQQSPSVNRMCHGSNLDCRLYNNSLASALGGACAGNQHHGIDPNMSNSGHHDSSRQAVFVCTADKLQCCTCWHIELSILGLLHLSISIHLSTSFRCSMKFFFGLALGESCAACATTEKTLMSSVYLFLFPWEGFPRQTCNNHVRRKQG